MLKELEVDHNEVIIGKCGDYDLEQIMMTSHLKEYVDVTQ